MIVLYLGLLGFLAFTIGVVILGLWLRRHPSKVNAENSSRAMHFLFYTGLVMPGLITIFYPGITRIDGLIGIYSLPLKTFFLNIGIILALIGLYFMVVSNKLLRTLGSGANAFRLTTQIVESDVYKYTRNPMSLGYYLLAISMGFISGSRFITFMVLLGLIPTHLLFLKFFEELELELRFGESYKNHKQKTPFLIPNIFFWGIILRRY